MQLKKIIGKILRKEYGDDPAWKAFIYWWLAANGYDYEVRRDNVYFTDGKGDGGIDAVAWPLENQGRNDVLVIQSKYYGQAPTEQQLERFQTAISALDGPLEEFHNWLDRCRSDLHPVYRRLRAERRPRRYVVIAPSRFPWNLKRSLRAKEIEVFDAERLQTLERYYSEGSTPRLPELGITGGSSPQKVAEGKGVKVWMFTATAKQLGMAFERYDIMLFAGNVRYALKGKTAKEVRLGIAKTIEECPDELIFCHNGITATGTKIQRRANTVIMRAATIVNGAQTVSYFGSAAGMRQLRDSQARVIIRFIEIEDSAWLNEIESKVAFKSNTQIKVEASDLLIGLSALVSLQRYFRRQGVHLERKKGEPNLYFGELRVPKERLVQILAAAKSPRGAVAGKSKQRLFKDGAIDLFNDYDASEKTRAEAVAWARVDDCFRTIIAAFANQKRKKRALIAELALLTAFNRVLKQTGLRSTFLRAMTRWDADRNAVKQFLDRSCRILVSALLRISSKQKKNEPAFYKALESVEPAVDSAVWHCRARVRRYYQDYLAN